MTAPPLVSILTPSFNQRRWLEENLASVEAQTYPTIEHIVMDGGSTDGTVALLQSRSSTRLRWRTERDRGQSHALNKAFAESRGSVIGWLNSDDAYFARDAVERAVEAFLRDPSLDVVYGHAVLVGTEGTVLQVLYVPPAWLAGANLHDHLVQPAVFIRRSALGERMVDESYDHAMDRELWVRLRGGRFGRLNMVLAADRHQPLRKSYTQADVARRDRRRLVATYGIADGRWHRARRRALNVAFRPLGLALVPALLRGGPALDARTRARDLVVRQLLRRRRAFSWE